MTELNNFYSAHRKETEKLCRKLSIDRDDSENLSLNTTRVIELQTATTFKTQGEELSEHVPLTASEAVEKTLSRLERHKWHISTRCRAQTELCHFIWVGFCRRLE